MLDHTISIQYMVGGYIVFFVLLAIYLASLIVRWKNLKRNLKSLDEVVKQDSQLL